MMLLAGYKLTLAIIQLQPSFINLVSSIK